jgi:hypothetical protein
MPSSFNIRIFKDISPIIIPEYTKSRLKLLQPAFSKTVLAD